MRIGMIGLGAMGAGIAGRLLAAGHELQVWNRSAPPVEALVRQGARAAGDAADVLGAEVVVTMLADDRAVEAVLLAPGRLDQARPGLLHVNCATISVDLARRLAARHAALGQAYVACPVLGRPDAAAAGQLVAILAGEAAALARAEPVVEAFTRLRRPVGAAPEQANAVKLACNFALAVMIETLGEAGALVDAHGVAPTDLFELMTSTLFAAPAYRTYADLIGRGAFEPAGFKLALGLKDVRLALAAGEAERVALPLASAVRDGFLEALAAGDGEKDWSALAGAAFRRAGRRLG